MELKKGIIVRDHISQLLDHEGYFLSGDDPNVRVMLVGNRVPPNLKKSLDHHGLEWREMSITHLSSFLREQRDAELVQCIADEEALIGKTITKPHTDRVKTHPKISMASSEKLVVPTEGITFLEEKYSLESRLEILSPELRPLFFEFHNRLIAAVGSSDFLPRTHIRGLTYRSSDRDAYIWLNFGKNGISLNFYTGNEQFKGLKKATWSKGGDLRGSLFHIQKSEDIPEAVEYGKKAYQIALKEKGF